jgi:hypothetical protein
MLYYCFSNIKITIMGIGGFFKNLFGSSKETVSDATNKAGEFAGEAIEKAKEVAAPVV